MSMLDSFRPFNMKEGVPYVSITNNGVTFNRSVIMKMSFPSHVKLLIDSEGKRIAIQRCDEKDQDSISFYKQKKNDVISVRWNQKDLIHTLEKMMEWDLSSSAFKVIGDPLPEEEAMIFDFNKAVPLTNGV